MKKFDVAVIGGGPGGYVAAIKAAQKGKKTCLIEKSEVGGICLNKGCIPTKTLLKSVQVLKQIRDAKAYGINGIDQSQVSIDMQKLQERKKKIITSLSMGVRHLLKNNGVEIFGGAASFVERNTLQVGSDTIKADNIIIASGSLPARIPIPISGKTKVITSDEALELAAVPADLVIIGGGVIGVEFAYLYHNLGANVTVIEVMDKILPVLDEEIITQVTKELERSGIKILTGSRVQKIENDQVYYQKGSEEAGIKADTVLMATGRTPNTSELNLEKTGIKKQGNYIVTDEHMRTNIPGIYAIGDVNGRYMLAHAASREGIVAVENICGNETAMDYSKVPQGIYIQPEIAAVGMTEKEAREKYDEVRIGRFPLSVNGKAMVEGESTGLIKVIVDKTYHEVLGVHIYGIHATDLIAEAVVAMKGEIPADYLAEAIHPHPTVSEIMSEAFQNAIGKAIHGI